MSLYKEILLDHFKNPRHHDQGQIAAPSFTVLEANPLCGDLVQVKGLVLNGVLTQAVFSGSGCVISQGSASILLEHLVGKPTSEILAFGAPDMLALIGMELGPNRIKCALLALIALQNGVRGC